MKRFVIVALACGTFLAGCQRKTPAADAENERQQLEKEKAALAAEKQKLAQEHEFAERRRAAEAEGRKLADEKEKLAAEKRRFAEEQNRAEQQKLEHEALERQNALNAAGVASNAPTERDAVVQKVTDERERLAVLKTQAEADRLAAERAAAEAKVREAAAKRADAEAAAHRSMAFFYDALAEDGDWYDTDRYGYVWQPKRAVIDQSWRPYTDGRWQWTDYGWTWQSTEPYGWAVFHYGRWFQHPKVGWLWVPGQEWAPAWVSWRMKSSDFVAWAPLPPASGAAKSYGAAVDRDLEIAPASYVILPIADFAESTYVNRFIEPNRRMEALRGSRNMTRIESRAMADGPRMVAGGPDPGLIASAIRQSKNDPEAQPVPRLDLVLGGKPSSPRPKADVVEGSAMLLPAPRLEKAAPDAKPKNVRDSLQVPDRDQAWAEVSPEVEAEFRAMTARQAAEANAPKIVAAPQRSATAAAPPPPKRIIRTTAPASTKPNPLNPARLETSSGLFDKR